MAKSKKTFVKKEETLEMLTPQKQSRFRLGKKGILLLTLLTIVLAVVAIILYTQYQKLSVLSQDPQQKTEMQNKTLLEKIGKLIMLPSEAPRIATVSDISKLVDQPFFVNAQNGDKVLIYEKAAKVILYRPNINKLIDVASLNTNIVASQDTITPQVTPTPATAVILNGTLTSGLAKNAQSKITTNLPNITVSKVGDSTGGYYDSTIIVDVSGKNQSQAGELAKLLGGKVQVGIPDGEITPTADILVILGSDYVK